MLAVISLRGGGEDRCSIFTMGVIDKSSRGVARSLDSTGELMGTAMVQAFAAVKRVLLNLRCESVGEIVVMELTFTCCLHCD